MEVWAGQMPHPKDLESYDELAPGSAQKIIDAFVSQSAHRQELEQLVVRGSEKRASRGQFLVFSLVGALILAGLAVALVQSAAVGGSMATGGVGVGGAIFIIGGRAPKQESG